MPGSINHKLGSKWSGEISNNPRYTNYTTLMAENKEELKSFLMRLREETEKGDLKFNVKKAKIMAVGPHHFMVKRRGKSRSSDRFYLEERGAGEGGGARL